MKLKIKGQFVEVRDERCRKRPCLQVGHYTHHQSVGASGCSSHTDEALSCLRRDRFGCPEGLVRP